MRRVLAIGALVSALTGCGTVSNLRRGPVTDATPYGGVEIAVEQCRPKRQSGDFIRVDFPAPLDVMDVALSAVGDTITLPVTLVAAVGRSINAYYFPPDEPKPNAWREFWSGDGPPPPRVPGAIW
jgi:uncharacterized protein YceK